MQTVLQIVNGLRQAGELGPDGAPTASPDEVLLLSGGPASHHARQSLIVQPPVRRAVLRQPTIVQRLEQRSILEEPVLRPTADPFLVDVQQWEKGAWRSVSGWESLDLDLTLARLEAEMLGVEPFQNPLEAWPSRPFLAGSFAYDLVQWTQPLSLQHPPSPGSVLAVLWEVRGALVVDQRSNSVHRLCAAGSTWGNTTNFTVDKRRNEGAPPSQEPSSSMDDEAHEAAIEVIRQAIVRGRMYQMNVGRRWSGPLAAEPWAVFERLQESNPAPFAAWVNAPDLDHMLLSSSPESLLRVERGRAMASPIKGSYPRGADPLEEEALRRALVNDAKETAEHRMLVDLMRNDLGAIAVPGSVDVQRYDVEAYATVQHLVSQVGADLEVPLTKAFTSVFPGGSITGCPRTVVCAGIDALEAEPRRFWCGSIGWWDPDGTQGSWSILIRTMQVQRTSSGWRADVHAGGGITIASHAPREIEETWWKAAPLFAAAGWGDAGSATAGTLRITPMAAPRGPPSGPRCGRRRSSPQGAVLLVDNLDSFTHNIAHAVMMLGHDVHVVQGRGHEALANPVGTVEAWLSGEPTHVILGPGPGRPEEATPTMLIAEQALRGGLPPALGICLGHQALALAAGGRVVEDPAGPVHGQPVQVLHDGTGLFAGLAAGELSMVRYNSLIVTGLNSHLLRTNARAGHVTMGITNANATVHGVQGHPESIGSLEGDAVLRAFLDAAHA